MKSSSEKIDTTLLNVLQTQTETNKKMLEMQLAANYAMQQQQQQFYMQQQQFQLTFLQVLQQARQIPPDPRPVNISLTPTALPLPRPVNPLPRPVIVSISHPSPFYNHPQSEFAKIIHLIVYFFFVFFFGNMILLHLCAWVQLHKDINSVKLPWRLGFTPQGYVNIIPWCLGSTPQGCKYV